jgi:hypothetical protein
MTTLFVRHQVADYAKWRQVYDTFGPVQRRFGANVQAVYRAADNPNDVTVTHEFSALEAAQQFAASDELRKAMTSAGIVGEPTIWFANKA